MEPNMNHHIVCTTCMAVNRIPQNKINNGPQCGKCQQPLLANKAIDIDSNTFQKVIRKTSLTVIIDFWAPWCGPCKMMTPIFNQAAQELSGQYVLLKVNTEQEQQLSARLGIRSIPTLIAYKNGKEVNRMSGGLQKTQLIHWIKSH